MSMYARLYSVHSLHVLTNMLVALEGESVDDLFIKPAASFLSLACPTGLSEIGLPVIAHHSFFVF